MKLYNVFILCLFPVLLFIVMSCSTEKPKEALTEPIAIVEEEIIPSSQAEPSKEEVIVLEDSESDQPAQEVPIDEEPENEPEPPEKTVEVISSGDDEFKVSEDVFKQIFSDIEFLIQELNSIIKSEDYESWQQYLTPRYKEEMSAREVLDKISDQPMLKKYNIKLETLRDYFSYVVVPSRSNARLDDLVFVDENNVKAIMVVSGQRSILYKLERTGNSWKIGIF